MKYENLRTGVSMRRVDETRIELKSGIGRNERTLMAWDRDVEDLVAAGHGWNGSVVISADDLKDGWEKVKA